MVAAVAAVLWTMPQRPVLAQSARPNIVVFLIDDMDVATVQTLLAAGLMPNLKRYFADVGFNFTQAFSVGAVGGPARASVLTGQYPHNHGVLGNYPPIGGVTNLNESSTIATWMRTAGYRTALVGRYMTGYGWWTPGTTVPPGWDDWQALLDPGAYSTRNYTMNLNSTMVNFGALATSTGADLYQTDVLTALSIGTIRRAAIQTKPLFMMVTPTVWNREILPVYNVCADPTDTGPFGGNFWGVSQQPATRHLNTVYGDSLNFPLPMPPSFNEDDVSDKPDWLQANPRLGADDVDCLTKRYWRKLEAMRAIDDMIGAVMGELQADGMLGRTLVMFTSDNGLVDGQHRFPEKTSAYEEAIHVPLWIRTPLNTVPRTIGRLVLNSDLAPTIAQLGFALPTITVDGRSLVPLMQNPDYSPWRNIGLFEYKAEGSQTNDRFTGPPDYVALRTGGATPRLYVKYPTVTTGFTGELYDLSLDPFELQNLFGDPARQAERDRLDVWMGLMKTCRGAGCWLYENYFTF